MKTSNVWALFLGLGAVTLLIGCATAGSDTVLAPRLEVYSPEFQAKLADEIEALPPVDCPRDVLIDGCTALGTFSLDAVHLRDRIGAVQ